jgi:hypothetical protein
MAVRETISFLTERFPKQTTWFRLAGVAVVFAVFWKLRAVPAARRSASILSGDWISLAR